MAVRLVPRTEGEEDTGSGGTAGRQSPPAGTKAPTTAKRGQLEIQLTDVLVGWGTKLALPAPLPGTVLVMRSPATAHALAELAKRDERIRHALERLVATSAVSELLTTVVMLAVAIMVEIGTMRPDAFGARMLGVTAVAEDLGYEMGEGGDGDGQSDQGGLGLGTDSLLAQLATAPSNGMEAG